MVGFKSMFFFVSRGMVSMILHVMKLVQRLGELYGNRTGGEL
jgi:hypothetical protein